MLLLVTLGCGRLDWKKFESTEGRFSVDLPGAPKEDQQKIPTPAGVLEQRSYLVKGDTHAFGVMYADYPPNIVTPGATDTLLDGAVDGAAKGVGGTANTRRPVTVSGHPGRAFETPTNQGYDYDARMVLVKNRLYQLVITSRPGVLKPEDKARFFESFNVQP
jgi:hypothetical protein